MVLRFQISKGNFIILLINGILLCIYWNMWIKILLLKVYAQDDINNDTNNSVYNDLTYAGCSDQYLFIYNNNNNNNNIYLESNIQYKFSGL